MTTVILDILPKEPKKGKRNISVLLKQAYNLNQSQSYTFEIKSEEITMNISNNFEKQNI